MYAHEVEPIILLHSRLEELNLAISECPKESLIPDITHPIECKFGVPFLQQHGLDENIVRFWGSSIVVYQSGYL